MTCTYPFMLCSSLRPRWRVSVDSSNVGFGSSFVRVDISSGISSERSSVKECRRSESSEAVCRFVSAESRASARKALISRLDNAS